MCNLYSLTKGPQAIRDFTRAMRGDVGNMPPLPGIFPDYFAPIVRKGSNLIIHHVAANNRVCAKRPSGIDVKGTFQIATMDAASGRPHRVVTRFKTTPHEQASGTRLPRSRPTLREARAAGGGDGL